MLRTLYLLYFFIIALPLFLVITILSSTIAILGCLLGGQAYFSYYPGKVWSILSLMLFLMPVEIKGREHLRNVTLPAMVMANHQSSLDIFLMYGYLGIPFRWVMKASLRKIPFIGKACEASGFIFVDDTKRLSIEQTIRDGKNVLASGNSIFIFPEGHRTRTGEMARFKKGGFIMSYELSKPIIPISIHGAFEALPIHKKIPTPRRLTLTIHPAIEIDKEQPFPIAINDSIRAVSQSIASAL